jgi:two-component system, OmpR family, phosphate regulon response regulator PhoB
MIPFVLIVEDDEAISDMLQYNLKRDGFDATIAADGEEAMTMVNERKPDIILLDWMLPKLSGIEVCRRLRSNQNFQHIPIIMITARGEEYDRVIGLENGADDYITKPFSIKELLARIRSVLRRTRPLLTEKVMRLHGITVDTASHKVTFQDRVMELGPTEFRLLTFFMENAGKVYSRDRLLDAVWGTDIYVGPRTVDVHVRRLRKAMEDMHPGLENAIETVRSAGYMMLAKDT